MIHLASQTAMSWYWLWHPLIGPGYQFWSGIASDVGEVTVIGACVGMYRVHNCAAPRCWRIGRHPTADGMHKLCRRCHPDLPKHRLSLDEIRSLHHTARHHDTTRSHP